jgi:hypothetical protein
MQRVINTPLSYDEEEENYDDGWCMYGDVRRRTHSQISPVLLWYLFFSPSCYFIFFVSIFPLSLKYGFSYPYAFSVSAFPLVQGNKTKQNLLAYILQ